MISPTLDSLRIALHLLAVAVWVGGQIVLAGVVPAVRRSNREVLPVIARAFGRVAWPAMGVVVATGMWGIASVDVTARRGEYLATFAVKMAFVGTAIAATVVHQFGRTKVALALGGAAGMLASLGAMWMGVLLAHVG